MRPDRRLYSLMWSESAGTSPFLWGHVIRNVRLEGVVPLMDDSRHLTLLLHYMTHFWAIQCPN